MTPLKAIRAKCLECCCDSTYEVKMCESRDCSLWQYRLGHNPNRKRELTDEQRAEIAERFKNAKSN